MRESKLCGSVLVLGDDYGDNPCTFRCQLPKGHTGSHSERFINTAQNWHCWMQWDTTPSPAAEGSENT